MPRNLFYIACFVLIHATVLAENVALKDYYEIPEVNQEGFTSGTFHVEGYVVKIYTCPPCPEGAVCAVCMPSNIVVSRENKRMEKYDLTDEDLIVFVDDVIPFRVGKKYRFLVQVLDVKSTEQRSNNLRLIYFEPVRS